MITWGWFLLPKETLAITDKVFFIILSKEKLGNGVRLRQPVALQVEKDFSSLMGLTKFFSMAVRTSTFAFECQRVD